uniref:Beta-mannosidase n=1 Tax=Clytia hemisphaerica TaxID=252671 RepID=A0A7M5UUN3_9CNID
MFASLSVPVHSLLISNNILEVKFESPTLYAKNQSDLYLNKFGYKIPPVVAPPAQHGRDHPNFIRKEQCSFSWDWGPSVPTIGIWQPAYLEMSDTVFLDKIKVSTFLQNGTWTLIYEIIVESFVKQQIHILYQFLNSEWNEVHDVVEGVQLIKLSPIVVKDESVNKWWPTGYGGQYLYTAIVDVYDSSLSVPAIHKEVKFGFRTVELVEEPIENSEGLSFYFKINGQPIFLKGANWIPADSFQEDVTDYRLEELMTSAKMANINALRVWGGGIYEKDKFYQLADEQGILIWQDLMFAVALYPVNEEFLQSVSQEISYQTRRLHHHPSIIAWSGNNENEAAIAQSWWDEVKTNRERLTTDYGKLYADTIKPIIESEDKTRPYFLSSPSNGNENVAEKYIAKNPQDERFGDVHFYDYKKDCWDPDTFPKPRFASEYGYQSYPSFQLLEEVSWKMKDQLYWNSSLMFHRQHHANGNMEIEAFVRQHFELPRSSKNTTLYLSMMVYLSQIVQSLCIKYESEHYRRLQDTLIDGKGHTMGALYWQLNDIWPGPSWSSLEYNGQWKILHYDVEKFFAPTSLSAYRNKDSIVVNIVRDHISNEKKLLCNISFHDWKEFGILWNKTWLLDLSSNQHSIEIFQKSITELQLPESSYMTAQLMDFETGDVVSSTELFLSNFSGDTLKNPNIKWRIDRTQRKENGVDFDVILSLDAPSAFVWLDTPNRGRFRENGILINTPTRRLFQK